MKLSELMAGYTPSESYAGVANNDDFVLAIDIAESPGSSVGDFVVVQTGVSSVDAQLSPETQEKNYIRAGKSTQKTSTQRTFALSGDRMHGDAFQDFALGFGIKFGTGQKVIRPYVYFSLLTGKGEKGTASIVVNSDGSGESGNTAEISIDIMATSVPTEYTWSASE